MNMFEQILSPGIPGTKMNTSFQKEAQNLFSKLKSLEMKYNMRGMGELTKTEEQEAFHYLNKAKNLCKRCNHWNGYYQIESMMQNLTSTDYSGGLLEHTNKTQSNSSGLMNTIGARVSNKDFQKRKMNRPLIGFNSIGGIIGSGNGLRDIVSSRVNTQSAGHMGLMNSVNKPKGIQKSSDGLISVTKFKQKKGKGKSSGGLMGTLNKRAGFF